MSTKKIDISKIKNELSEQSAFFKARSISKFNVLDRPKAFYITKKQDKDLDNLVKIINTRLGGTFKVDRSIILRSIIDYMAIDEKENVDKLTSFIVSQLITKLQNEDF